MRRRLKPETLLRRFKTFCVICKRRITRKRQRRRAITCSAAHQKWLTKLRKIERDHRQCSVCGRPSTPDERREFRAFRSSKVQDRQPKKVKAEKGILGAATGNQKMEDFAYVVIERPKSRGGRSAPGGHAA